MPAHGTGAAGPAGPSPPEGVGARHARGDDQRTARRGRRPGRSRALGRRSAHRAGTLRDRHARRAHDPLHDADPPAPRGRLRHDPAHEERARARRLRRGHDEERAGRDDDDAARAAAPIADLGPRQRTLRSTPRSRSRPASRSTSPTRRAPGSAARTRTPTGCSASTSRKAPTSRAGAPRRSKPSLPRSTADPARPSAGGHPPKPSTNTYAQPTSRCCDDRLNLGCWPESIIAWACAGA